MAEIFSAADLGQTLATVDRSKEGHMTIKEAHVQIDSCFSCLPTLPESSEDRQIRLRQPQISHSFHRLPPHKAPLGSEVPNKETLIILRATTTIVRVL